jgi:hypothetical protein
MPTVAIIMEKIYTTVGAPVQPILVFVVWIFHVSIVINTVE